MTPFEMSQWEHVSGSHYRVRQVTAFRTLWDSLWDVRQEHFGILQDLLIIGFLRENPKVGKEKDYDGLVRNKNRKMDG